MVDAPIKVIKNFIKEPEISSMIEYIDLQEQINISEFAIDQGGKRIALQFGKELNDNYDAWGHSDLSLIPEKRELIQDYFRDIVSETKKGFTVEKDIHVCSFWLAKQYPGAVIESHQDTEGFKSLHLKYSAILYLNTMKSGGELYFESFKYTYKPEAGDLVLFPSFEAGAHGVNEINETRYNLVLWMTYLDSLAIS
jgi:hypothetical protein